MLVYSKVIKYPKTPNVMTLEMEGDKGYIFATKSVYDEALKLSVKIGQLTMEQLLNTEESVNKDIIQFAFEQLPEPVNMLAPLLGLVSEQLPEDIEKLVGALHSICMTIQPYGFVKQPREIRELYKPSSRVLKEYEQAWKAFDLQCVSEDIVTHGVPFVMGPAFGGQYQMPMVQPTPQAGAPQSQVSQAKPLPDKLTDADFTDDILERFKVSPNWVMMAQGIWQNTVSDQTVEVQDDSYTEEDAQKEFEAMAAEVRKEQEAKDGKKKEEVKVETKKEADPNRKLTAREILEMKRKEREAKK